MERILCDSCGKRHAKDSLRRSCANCFLCAGCEIYHCPSCQEEIVVTPMRIAEYSQRDDAADESQESD